jgi:hypothetical protein
MDPVAKLLDKLNIRITDVERERFGSVSARAGYPTVSAWARSVLVAAADAAKPARPRGDVAIYITSERVLFAAESDAEACTVVPALGCYSQHERCLVAVGDAAFEMQTHGRSVSVEPVLSEGHIVDPEAFLALIRYGLSQIQERFDVASANIVVTGRILPAVTLQIRDLVRKAARVGDVFTMEHLMAGAVGIGIQVDQAVHTPVICVADDWLEAGLVYCSGLQRKRSVGTALLTRAEIVQRVKALATEYCDAAGGAAVHVIVSGEFDAMSGLEGSGQMIVYREASAALHGVRRTLPAVRKRFAA